VIIQVTRSVGNWEVRALPEDRRSKVRLGSWTAPRGRRVAGGVLGAAAALAVLLGTGGSLGGKAPARGGARAKPVRAAGECGPLAAELGGVRATEGRLAGQSTYAPYPTPLDPRRDAAALRRLQRQVFERRSERWSARSLDEHALLSLVKGRVDEAASAAEEAVRRMPGDAGLLCDLAAIYLERARHGDRSEDYVAALDAAERALGVGSERVEPAFNRAVALEHLFLEDLARGAWRHYLELDPRSPWAEEARTHLEKLGERAGRPSGNDPAAFDRRAARIRTWAAGAGKEGAFAFVAPVTSREEREDRLLSTWAEAMALGDDASAELQLASCRRLARSLAARGDGLLQKIVAEMELAARAPAGRAEREVFVESLRRLGSGRADLKRHHIGQAIKEFRAAEQGLLALRSPAVLLARVQRAACLLEQGESRGARAALLRLGEDPRLATYPSVEGRRQRLLGMAAQRLAEPTAALASYSRGIDSLDAIGDRDGVAWLHSLMAESLESLGRSTEAWRQRYQALAWGDARGAEDLLHDALDQAARAALVQRRPQVALDFQTRLVTVAEGLGQPEEIAFTLLRRARIAAALGRRDEAKPALEHAAAGLVGVEDAEARALLTAEIDVVGSEIRGSEDPAQAAQAVSRALKFHSRSGIEPLVPELLGARAGFEIRLGDTTAAERDFARALDEVERQRAQVTPGSYRISFLDQAQSLYERSVALQLKLGRPERALEVLERSRSRALLDQLREIAGPEGLATPAGTGATPLGWRELCRRLPAQTVIAVYAVVEGRLATWLVRRSGVELLPHQPPWELVADLVRGLREALVGRDPALVRRCLERLESELVAPWRDEVGAGERIVFVPTGALYRVPFAALRDARSGRFLVEDHATGVAPSASVFVQAAERDRRMWTGPLGTALVVGDPRLGEWAHGLAALPGAAREAAAVGGIYRGVDVRVLLHDQATVARVRERLPESDIAHLAVHAFEDRENPARSRLMLASQGGASGDLMARDILGLRLPRTRLVVLAACDSQAGPVSPSEGSLSLASSFLAAGVTGVVGNLWKVEDSSGVRLSVRLHEEVRRGADALAALRTAQLELLAAPRDENDWTWAGFQVFGGVALRTAGMASGQAGDRRIQGGAWARRSR
jgi:CHAT domain-containing protein/tetratricopeptide (TPR) repeat protein